MTYNVIFRIEKFKLIDKLKGKITNLKKYMEEEGHDLNIEVVFAGDVVKHFKEDYSDFIDSNLDIALCRNALKGYDMDEIYDRNIRTVRAGIGEIIIKKSKGWIEYTIE